MFTIAQIQQAHSKVKSGADFPTYIKDLKQLSVKYYVTYVSDGRTDYFDVNGSGVSAPAKYDILTISQASNPEQFKADLKAHQQGKTDYPTFCRDCAKSGVEKWEVSIEKMTCTYFDKADNEILVEVIPE